MTQIMNLLLLAPEIQEAILTMPPVIRGRDPVSERMLRRIVAEPNWQVQLCFWNSLLRCPASEATGAKRSTLASPHAIT